MKTRFMALEVPYPGAALDIDNAKDYEAMKKSNIGSEINGVGLQLGARKEDGEIVVISPL